MSDNLQILDDLSARLSTLHPEATCVYLDHYRITKFASKFSHGFDLVCAVIQDFVTRAPGLIKSHWITEKETRWAEKRSGVRLTAARNQPPQRAQTPVLPTINNHTGSRPAVISIQRKTEHPLLSQQGPQNLFEPPVEVASRNSPDDDHPIRTPPLQSPKVYQTRPLSLEYRPQLEQSSSPLRSKRSTIIVQHQKVQPQEAQRCEQRTAYPNLGRLYDSDIARPAAQPSFNSISQSQANNEEMQSLRNKTLPSPKHTFKSAKRKSNHSGHGSNVEDIIYFDAAELQIPSEPYPLPVSVPEEPQSEVETFAGCSRRRKANTAAAVELELLSVSEESSNNLPPITDIMGQHQHWEAEKRPEVESTQSRQSGEAQPRPQEARIVSTTIMPRETAVDRGRGSRNRISKAASYPAYPRAAGTEAPSPQSNIRTVDPHYPCLSTGLGPIAASSPYFGWGGDTRVLKPLKHESRNNGESAAGPKQKKTTSPTRAIEVEDLEATEEERTRAMKEVTRLLRDWTTCGTSLLDKKAEDGICSKLDMRINPIH